MLSACIIFSYSFTSSLAYLVYTLTAQLAAETAFGRLPQRVVLALPDMASLPRQDGRRISGKWAQSEPVNNDDDGWENFLNFERKKVFVSHPVQPSAGATDLLAVPQGQTHLLSSGAPPQGPLRRSADDKATPHKTGKMRSHT